MNLTAEEIAMLMGCMDLIEPDYIADNTKAKELYEKLEKLSNGTRVVQSSYPHSLDEIDIDDIPF